MIETFAAAQKTIEDCTLLINADPADGEALKNRGIAWLNKCGCYMDSEFYRSCSYYYAWGYYWDNAIKVESRRHNSG